MIGSPYLYEKYVDKQLDFLNPTAKCHFIFLKKSIVSAYVVYTL